MGLPSKILIVLALVWGALYAAPTFFGNQLPDFFPDKTINLGLDLQGGSHLLLEADTQIVVDEALRDARTAVAAALSKAKVRATDIKETAQGFRFDIDPTQYDLARKTVRKAILYKGLFKQNGNTVTYTFTDQELDQLHNNAMERTLQVIRLRVDETGTKEPSIQRQGKNRVLLQLPGVDDPAKLQELLGKTARLTFHLVDESVGSRGYVTDKNAKVPFRSKVLPTQEGQFIAVNRVPMLGGDTLTDARQNFYESRPIVNITFNTKGGKKFGRVTTENVNKLFAIVLDGEVISAPNIQEPIVGGSSQISGGFTVEEAQNLALLLRSGALPAPITIIEERTVGPSLGEDSIAAGKAASTLGLVAVIVLIILVYQRMGLYAATALIVNLILLVALLSTLGATLTLPGIAGIVLTIGMAVDANVLVFERIKEELRLNKTPFTAVRDGYSRAFTTILDANITTLIAAIILFSAGSGPVKGFAVTLGLGILTSLFSAMLVTQWFVLNYVRSQQKSSHKRAA